MHIHPLDKRDAGTKRLEQHSAHSGEMTSGLVWLSINSNRVTPAATMRAHTSVLYFYPAEPGYAPSFFSPRQHRAGIPSISVLATTYTLQLHLQIISVHFSASTVHSSP